MEDILNIVMVGCGSMSGAWLHPAMEIEGVRIVGLVDIVREAAQRRAEEFGLTDALISNDLTTVLDRCSPDIVFDCSLPATHSAVTLEALAHGCHVLGEKPLADSMENARRSVAAAKAAGRTYAVMQNRRYDWRLRRLRQLAESGELGALTTFHSDFFLGAHFGGFRDRMRHVLLLDMAIHTFDAARCILGADPVSVWAKEWNPAGSWYDHDASAVAYFQMTGGIVYTYRGSWCAEGLSTTWETDWRLLGASGSIKWDGADYIIGEKAIAGKGFNSDLAPIPVPARDPSAKDGGHAGLIKDFIHCIKTGAQPETAASDNIKSLAMVFAAIESSETGRVVEID